MQASSIPAKFPIPFAKNAGSGYIRTIPEASQIGIQAGAASLNDGYPPTTMTVGGTPPFGQDMNGILNLVTAWNQWQQAGGPIPYDATFQTAIGGYPKGAIVESATTSGKFWMSTADNNATNPDASGAGWLLVVNNVGQFPSSLTTNGWKKYPDPNSPTGYFIEQWGEVSTANPGTPTVNFPIAFPNVVFHVIPGVGSSGPVSGAAGAWCGAQAISLSQFSVLLGDAGSGAASIWWTAKGY